MERRLALGALVIAVTALVSSACATDARNRPSPFEVTHVTLYDCGLAQLERQTTVKGHTKLEIRLGLAHLDDLLSSLFLATDGDVSVKGIRYPSVHNLGQARSASSFASMMADDEESLELPGSVEGYARALVGTPVSVKRHTGDALAGTLLACTPGSGIPANGAEPGEAAGASPRPSSLVLVLEDGSLAWVPLGDVSRIVPRAEREAQAMQAFASHLGRANGFEEVAITIETSADSSGRLGAGYIRQMPLWRTVYKVSAGETGVQLEAWSVVHNDTTEDWKDVQLTLISGLPQSYVFSIASPRYAERELLYLADDLQMFPQLGAGTPDSLLYDWTVQMGYSAAYGSASLGARGYGSGGGSSSAHYGGGSVQSSVTTDSSLLLVGDSAAEEQVEPSVEQEISTYRALQKTSIPRRSSSMVPLIRRPLKGESYTLISDAGGAEPPTCVRVENGTGLVLQAGVGTFYINGRFRGQAELDRTEPGDIREWCFGHDPDISSEATRDFAWGARALEWKNGSLWTHSVRTTTTRHTISNKAGQDRKVAIRVAHRANGRVLSPENLLEGEGSARLLPLTVPARSDEERTVVIEEGIMQTVVITSKRLGSIAANSDIPAKQREVVKLALPSLVAADKVAEKAGETDARIQKLRNSIDRKRASLQSVPQIAAKSSAVERMLNDLLKTENDLGRQLERKETLEKEAAMLREKARVQLQALAGKPLASTR